MNGYFQVEAWQLLLVANESSSDEAEFHMLTATNSLFPGQRDTPNARKLLDNASTLYNTCDPTSWPYMWSFKFSRSLQTFLQ